MALVDMAAWRASKGMTDPDPRQPGEPSREELISYARQIEGVAASQAETIARLQEVNARLASALREALARLQPAPATPSPTTPRPPRVIRKNRSV